MSNKKNDSTVIQFWTHSADQMFVVQYPRKNPVSFLHYHVKCILFTTLNVITVV